MKRLTHRIFSVFICTIAGLFLHQATAAKTCTCFDDDTTGNGVILSETFNAFDFTGGRDGKFTGNIATGKFDTSLTDNVWKTSGTVNGAYQCARVGIAEQDGSMTTPVLNLNGEATLTCDVAGWGINTNTMTITAQGAVINGNSKNIKLENKVFTRYSFQITAGGNFTLTFKGRRFFIDDILLTECETGIENVHTDEETSALKVFDLQGRRVQNPQKGLYIVNGRKVVM